jgi:transposase-like protein
MFKIASTARIARVTNMVDINACYFAHQRKLANGPRSRDKDYVCPSCSKFLNITSLNNYLKARRTFPKYYQAEKPI